MIQYNVDLRALNTLSLPGKAARYIEVSSAERLSGLLRLFQEEGGRFFILGNGSNLVITQDFDGCVLRAALPGRRLVGEDTDAWHVGAGAGEDWSGFVRWTLEQGWPGLENLSSIPGTVGAAPVQNIGAYGLELADRFLRLMAFDLKTGKSVCFDAHDCRFSYRDSVFKQEGWHLHARYLITEVVFALPKRWTARTAYADIEAALAARKIDRPTAREIADIVMAARRRKLPDPADLPNAGSFFKNPVVSAETLDGLRTLHPDLPYYPQPDGGSKIAAGWLIERAGWKGKRQGPVGLYEKQALILVNHGGARGADVVALTLAIQADVKEKFGISLTPEPVFL